MTTTVALVTVSELALFTVPDVYMVLNPDTTLTVFYVVNLNKGIPKPISILNLYLSNILYLFTILGILNIIIFLYRCK